MEHPNIDLISAKLKHLTVEKLRVVEEFIDHIFESDAEASDVLKTHIDEILVSEKKELFVPLDEAKKYFSNKYGL
jgi:hypothetical protein